jgi:hypothetical protein
MTFPVQITGIGVAGRLPQPAMGRGMPMWGMNKQLHRPIGRPSAEGIPTEGVTARLRGPSGLQTGVDAKASTWGCQYDGIVMPLTGEAPRPMRRLGHFEGRR